MSWLELPFRLYSPLFIYYSVGMNISLLAEN